MDSGVTVQSSEDGPRSEAEPAGTASGISSIVNQVTDLPYEHTPPEAGKKSTDAGHGNRFQSKLLILYAIRAINFGFQFYLGTELPVGDKFDDLIFHYKDENDASVNQKDVTKTTFRQQYLQAKHRLNEQVGITADQLINTTYKNQDTKRSNVDTGDFSLLKYFQSYVKIKSKGNNVEHCIICSNVDFNHRDIQINGIALERVDDKNLPKLLDNKGNPQDVKKDQTCYKLKIANDKFKSISSDRMRTWLINYTKDEMKYLFENCTDEMITSFFVNCQDKVNEKPLSDYTADEIKDIFDNLKDKKEIQHFFQNYGETIVACFFEGFLVCFLDDFLEKLIFSVNMPNEDELDLVLAKEVGKYFKLTNAALPSAYIMNEMVNWFKRQENHWLTAKEAEDILDKRTKEMIAIDQSTYLSIDYQNHLKQWIEFNDSAVEQLTCILEIFLKNSSQKTMQVNSGTPKLTAVKVISAINNMANFPNNDDYLVISSKRLREDIKEFGKWLKVEKCHQLLVIVDEDAKNPIKDIPLYENLIPENSNKKIIVIISNQNISEDGSYQDIISYEQLSDTTKKLIGKRQILFQGTCLTVNELIDVSQTNKILDSLSIENLLRTGNDKLISIPSFNFSSFNQSLYIKRKLTLPKSKTINKEIQIDSSKETQLHVRNNQEGTGNEENLTVLLEQNNSLNNSSTSEVNEAELIGTSTKRIITGVAGTGKSTILSHYYNEIKRVKPDNFVIMISLMNYSKALKELEELNENSINEFLVNNVIVPSAFARVLLKHRLETGDRIIFMFDGFDEIDNECQDKVVQLIKYLNESIPVYITTRPHLADKLQYELSQLPYSLVKFTKEDQINYLTSVWKEYFIKENVVCEEETINSLAINLIDRVSETLNDKEKDFIGIPLQCRILAECFQSKIKHEIIENPNTDHNLSHLLYGQQFDLASLYKSLMEEKRKVFRKEKIRINFGDSQIVDDSIEKNIKQTELHLRKLAVQSIVSQQKHVEMLIPEESQSEFEKKKKEKELNENGIRLGLLDEKIDRNGVQFLHRTYAEYLVADYVFNGLLLDEDRHNKLLENKSTRKWIVTKLLVYDNYEGVRHFLDSMLKEITKEKFQQKIQTCNLPDRLQQLISLLFLKENIRALREAFKEKNANIILFILDCIDQTFHETPSKTHCVIIDSISYPLYQRTDLINRILNYFDNTEDENLLIAILKEWCDAFHYVDERELKQENVNHFLDFMERHKEQMKLIKDRYSFEKMATHFIHNDGLRRQFLQIVIFISSDDSDLTDLLKGVIIEYLSRINCQISRIENTLANVREFGRDEVAAGISRFILLRESETLHQQENVNVRSSLEEIGMTGLHGAACKGDLKFIEKEIGCSLENPNPKTYSKKIKSTVKLLLANKEDIVPPLHVAAAYGREEICQKIFTFLDPKKEMIDKVSFFSYKDFILLAIYENGNVLMFETILKSFKAVWGQSSLVELLKLLFTESRMLNVFFTNNRGKLFESMTSIVVQDDDYRDFNDLIFHNEDTLVMLEHVQPELLQHLITETGGLECWVQRLMKGNVNRGFGTLGFEDFLHKFNQLNEESQISKLIDILILRRPLPGILKLIGSWWKVGQHQPSNASSSYWSDFVKSSVVWEMEKFLESISKNISEEDLKRLVLSRDDNNIIILLQFLIRNGRDDFTEILSGVPENLKRIIEDLERDETSRSIDHFFSSSTFLISLRDNDCLFNAINYFLENGNQAQLSKFNKVVTINLLKKALKNKTSFEWIDRRRKFAHLFNEKLSNKTAEKYKNVMFVKHLRDKSLSDSEMRKLEIEMCSQPL